MQVMQKVEDVLTNKIKVGALVVATLAFGALTAVTPSAQAVSVNAHRDCDNNAVIKCGALSTEELIADYNGNASAQKIFTHFGISAEEVAAMNSTAVVGEVTKSGEVKVDGKVVATGAITVGRQNIGNSTKVTEGGVTFYKRAPVVSFKNDSLKAFVVMQNGEFAHAVIASCGNPVTANPVPKPKPKPVVKYACEALNMTKVNRTTYRFEAKATAQNATIEHYVYEFGDGSEQKTTETSVEHTYEKAGTYTAKVTAYVNVNGELKPATGAACTKQVTVQEKPAAYECEALNMTKVNRTTYRFEAKATAQNATIEHYVYEFGDGSEQKTTETSVEHTYEKAGTYTAKVTAYVNVNGELKPATGSECEQTVTVEDQPVVTPTPEVLPVTGAASVFGLGAVTTVLGTAIHQFITRRRLNG